MINHIDRLDYLTTSDLVNIIRCADQRIRLLYGDAPRERTAADDARHRSELTTVRAMSARLNTHLNWL